MLPDIPTRIETERLYLRGFQAGDGEWYYAASQRNREHLRRYESENVILSIKSLEEAEALVRDLADEWARRRCFFMGAFEKSTHTFVAQIYIGPVNWDLPEFEIGFFADKDHEGRGYVTEAVRGALQLVFEHLKAQRVRMECDDTNLRSLRVAERCGMVKEGHVPENKRNPDGSLSGTLFYGLLKSEYEGLKALFSHKE